MKAIQIVVSDDMQVQGHSLFFSTMEKALSYIKDRNKNATFYHGDSNNEVHFQSLVIESNWWLSIRAHKEPEELDGSVFDAFLQKEPSNTYYHLSEITID